MKLTQNNLKAMYILQSLAFRAHRKQYTEGQIEAPLFHPKWEII